MGEAAPLHRRLLRRFRGRVIRDMRALDARGRLGRPPPPIWLGVATFVLSALLGLTTYFLGRSSQFALGLFFSAVGLFGIAVAVGFALAMSEYLALQDFDRARAELLAVHEETEEARRRTESIFHDARAVTGALDAALHALARSWADAVIVAALRAQVLHLQDLLQPEPPDRTSELAVDDLVKEAASFAALYGGILISEAAPDARVLAVREHVVAILQNLLDNARKYAPGSPVLLTCEAAGPYLKIVLEDRGPGIPPVEAESMFLPATRRGDGGQGFGMGLAIARSLAEGMQGALWWEPHPGRGSRFILKLPRASPPPGVESPGAS